MQRTAVPAAVACFAALSAAAATKCGLAMDAVAPRIVGGQDVGGYRYPWFALLQFNNQSCGAGTLVSQFHVLTAAHVLIDERIPKTANRSVLLGVYNQCRQEAGAQRYNMERFVTHENYTGGVFDIAIVTLDRAAHYIPACLPRPRVLSAPPQPVSAGRDALVAGYGVLQDDLLNVYARVPCTMREAHIRTIPRAECLLSELPKKDVQEPSMFCAGLMAGGTGICTGDSGGGLLRLRGGRYVVEGVAVGGELCAAPNSPSIFTNVTYFMGWVHKYMVRKRRSKLQPVAVSTVP